MANRLGLRVRGVVQGVGFRPFVHRLAREESLSGNVHNDEDGVWIEVEGTAPSILRFRDRLAQERPSLSRIDSIQTTALDPRGSTEFAIVETQSRARAKTIVPPDVAPCEECLKDLADPRGRRHRYPFVNCTSCGPRFSLVRELPYDRARTTMDAFALCAECLREYQDPTDRRFHAEPNACPSCGPHLTFLGSGIERQGAEALAAAASAIERGLVVAIKGVGGFQLAVRADDESAIKRLRTRKRRPHKPFALMARDLEQAKRVASFDDPAELLSPARPIVLLPLRGDAPIAQSVAPGLREIGVMLPASPLHALLLADGPPLQVMTSGNVTDEPIAKDDDDALRRLDGIADAFLLHDREIHTRLDDSVVRSAGRTQMVRRGRGYVPGSIDLGVEAPPILAVGADTKNTVCVVRDRSAFISQHIGDLSDALSCAFFVETIEKLAHLLDVEPTYVAHDLHPDYRSTRWALATNRPRIAVQHHHAHVVSCLAEHGRMGPAIGVAFDGTGCGLTGDLWGGEILVFDRTRFERVGHLRAVGLPGAEAAIREPWRIAVAALMDAGERVEVLSIDPKKRELVERMVSRSVATPRATGAGRWFDAVAALIGLRPTVSYEGQAAIELEAIAAEGSFDSYPFELHAAEVDLRPMVVAIARDVRQSIAPSVVSARFHETMARIVEASCRRARVIHGLSLVALSGGTFQNVRLTARVLELLHDFEVLVHRDVPPNDGGISLGQAAVAAARLTKG